MKSFSKDTLLFATLVAAAIGWTGLSAAGPAHPAPAALRAGLGSGIVASAVHDGTARALCAATRADPATLVGLRRTTC